MPAAPARRFYCLGLVAAALLAAVAQADTIATFADPATSGATPLFELIGNKLNGGWDDPGLDLIMPVVGQTYPDATFEMTELTWNGGMGLSGGTLRFYDQYDNLVLRIDFDGALLYGPFGFGASDLAGQAVSISGPGIPSGLMEESFAFSFANQNTIPGGFSWTASFTSSAIPEPGSLVLIGLGLFQLMRRR